MTPVRDGDGSFTCSRWWRAGLIRTIAACSFGTVSACTRNRANASRWPGRSGARVVFNDAVRAREDARRAGRSFPKAAELSKRLITQAKRTAERAWLGEVSAVVLQQSLRDAESAYRNFFASLQGERKGSGMGAPRFKSRKDARQSIRFTANARWSITSAGRLNLPKIGEVRVMWSRTLPAVPSSVTVIKDAAGRYFASFVIDTDPATDLERMPDSDASVGIDLGLTHFAVLSDGTTWSAGKTRIRSGTTR
ncbi:hypothetical protein GCM10011579_021290 [Streptomyces albiflavescens]|uniref:Transposase n=1 Tax=Streptomyces albiflavescens TaxID=1623582 RepID=A0A917XZF5_9ACTN|nr:hypothetical protein GCM10011579_021290 [Streptomyces albiflavescens]